MSISIFSYTDYKDYFVCHFKELGEPWGYWNKMAKAISCQPAYLSRCLYDKTQLTVDQIINASHFLSLSNTETEYLICMLEYARATTKSTQEYFLNRLNVIRNENENLKTRLKKDNIRNDVDQPLYYSSWLWMAIHFATSIEELQTIESISKRFQITPVHTLQILEKLSSMGLVTKEGNKWIFLSGEFHLSKESPLIAAHHQNWRTRAVIDSQDQSKEGLHYSAVYTLSKKDFIVLKEEMINWINKARKIVSPSKEEEIVCFSLDLFKI